MMNKRIVEIHKADDRGEAQLPWLRAKHSFSFSSYYNPQRMGVGALRVLNDDIIAAGKGFDFHPHENMEIITIPLFGELEHRDSLGHSGVIKAGDVQVMSAGTGITHSEMNPSPNKPVQLFQIWIQTAEKDVEPRYDQASYDLSEGVGKFKDLVGPMDSGFPLEIYQDAEIKLGSFLSGMSFDVNVAKRDHLAYLMLIQGEVQVEDMVLEDRDAIVLSSSVSIKAHKDSSLLWIDVPNI